jgi:outer membrane protein
MKLVSIKMALIVGASLSILSTPVYANDGYGAFDKERFQLRLRGIGVLPDGGGNTSIGGKPDADNAFVPEFDITYFFTDHLAAELILATSPHDLTLKTATGNIDLGETMILPPTLTMQYHFTPERKFSPYVGAGINYTLPYSEDNGTGTTRLEADGSFGYALQVGSDYWLNDHWGVNFDVKKVWVDVDASINSGAIRGNVDLNPWIVGAGVSYRF